MPSPRARRAAPISALATAALLVTTLAPTAYATPSAPVDAQSPPARAGRYIVTLQDKPIATYNGEVAGLAATRPGKGQRVDARSAPVERYRRHLQRQQTTAAARVGTTPLRHFAISLNGFAAGLTPDQARALARAPGVLSVVKDARRRLSDDQNPVDFLALSGAGGVWAALGGLQKAGRGVVVGVLDSGYWPQSASFAGPALGTAKPTSADPYPPVPVRQVDPDEEGRRQHLHRDLPGRCVVLRHGVQHQGHQRSLLLQDL